MIRYLFTTALSSAFLVSASHAATFEFSQQGYFGGGVFSGTFEGEDLNNDGEIVSFDNEITNINATFQGVGLDGSNIFTNFDFSSLNGFSENITGFVLALDGNGTIGDQDTGASEGFALDNGEYYIAVGPGPAFLCDGFSDCGFIYESNSFIDSDSDSAFGDPLSSSEEVIQVTSGPAGDATDLGSASNPFLPSSIDDELGGFSFELSENDINPFETFFIDPDIAVGYTYTVSGSTFHSVTAPTLGDVNDADGQYLLSATGISQTILSGETVFFGIGDDITEFTLTGIDVMPGLDPTDPLAFQTGVSVATFTGSVTIEQTPIIETVDDPNVVPLPAGILLLGSGLALLGATRRRAA